MKYKFKLFKLFKLSSPRVTIGDLRSQLEGHDGEAVWRQPPPQGLALLLRELNPEDRGSLQKKNNNKKLRQL